MRIRGAVPHHRANHSGSMPASSTFDLGLAVRDG